MSTSTSHGPIVIDRAITEATLWRVAICAFTYHPTKEADEPGFSLNEDVAWCAAPLARLPKAQRAELLDVIRNLITDPAADRREFIRSLAELVEQ